MIKNLFDKLFGRKEAIELQNIQDAKQFIESPQPIKRSSGYREEVKEKYGFDLPASDTDKIYLGKKFEQEADLEKACACYEGCIKNRFEGNGPYDRLIILYKKLGRHDDALRIVKKAISVFEKVSKQGRIDGAKKLEKYKSELEKITRKIA
ncbi:MAG: hypothetical protein KGZ88_16795 [Methylomicrobium sp.]|nr:hypothetical protein [Methylomicrobium sp.]